ncbi:MAG: hypothetical protein SGPRY_003686, partial [Prymnesium sp.]
ALNASFSRENKEHVAEVEELYTYLDTQMLTSTRERMESERKYKDEARDRQDDVSRLEQQLDNERVRSEKMVNELRRELQDTQSELESLSSFNLRPFLIVLSFSPGRGKAAQMEEELKSLRKELADSREKHRLEQHEQQVDFWREREAMRMQMLDRIRQGAVGGQDKAKSNFLDVTAEMLDSSVHRTIMENQHLTDELAVQSAEIEKLVHQNQATACGVHPRLGERAAMRRDLELQRQQEATEVRRMKILPRTISRAVYAPIQLTRSVARKKLAESSVQQQAKLKEQLGQTLCQCACLLCARQAKEQIDSQAQEISQQKERISKLTHSLRDAQQRVRHLTEKLRFEQLLTPPTPVANIFDGIVMCKQRKADVEDAEVAAEGKAKSYTEASPSLKEEYERMSGRPQSSRPTGSPRMREQIDRPASGQHRAAQLSYGAGIVFL